MRRRTHKSDHRSEIARMSLQVYRILDTVKIGVPQEIWGVIVNKLDEHDDGHGPTGFAEDEDDEFSHPERTSILVSSLRTRWGGV
jgi:hypothetical protein